MTTAKKISKWYFRSARGAIAPMEVIPKGLTCLEVNKYIMNKDGNSKVDEMVEKAKFYFINNKYQDAIKEYKKALKIDKENTEVLYNLGVAYESANQLEVARETYTLTLKIDPGHKLAKEHIDNMMEK